MSRLGLVFMAIILGFIALVAGSHSAHASTSTLADAQLEEAQRLQEWKLQLEDVVSGRDGLTLAGYALFFPDRDVARGLKEWRDMTLLQRRDLLDHASSLARGLWAAERNRRLVADYQLAYPGITPMEIDRWIDRLGMQSIGNCMGAAVYHPDFCLLMLGRVATRDEIRHAEAILGYYIAYLEYRERRDAWLAGLRMTLWLELPPPDPD